MPKNAFGARLSSCEAKSIVFFFFSIKSPLLGRCVNKRVQQISIQISLASDNFLTYSEKKLSLNKKKKRKNSESEDIENIFTTLRLNRFTERKDR